MLAVLKKPNNLIAALAVLIAAVVLIMPTPAGYDPKLMRAGAVLFAAVALFASHSLPEHFTSLSFMLLVVILGVAPPEIAFSGFMTSAVWLLFGGIFISIAIQHTGLTERIGRAGARLAALSYPKVLLVVTFASLSLGFFMPATISRIIILVPTALAIADALGFDEGRSGRRAIVLAASIGTFLPGSGVLSANLPNVVMAGSIETLYDQTFNYGTFLIWHFPVTGFLKALILVWVLTVMFPDKLDAPRQSETATGPVPRKQRLLEVILFGTMALWATDFLHGISPGHVSLLAALVIMLPVLGLVPEDTFQKRVNLTPFFYVAGILSVGAVVHHTGFGSIVAENLIEVTDPQPGHDFLNYMTLVVISTFVCLFATSPGAPVVLAPLAQDLAQAMGLPLFTVVNAMTHGVANILLPYVGPPFVVAMGLTQTPVRQGLKLCLIMAAITLVVLAPLTYLWWVLLGFFG